VTLHGQATGQAKSRTIPLPESGFRNTRCKEELMITYRPIAPLTTGRTGLMPALAAMALTAVLGIHLAGLR
jgi:hypothetical protein